MGIIRKLAVNTDSTSLASRMRQERSKLFWDWAKGFGPSVRILDVGGTVFWWKNNAEVPDFAHHITLFNLPGTPVPEELEERFDIVFGDARDLSEFEDQSFDIVFSNSVIEHVGRLQEQQKMASELRRVGKHYFIQTPNRCFPMEPHFLFPFWQFLPLRVRASVLRYFNVGWVNKQRTYFDATVRVEEIRLLTLGELQHLFPDAEVLREKVSGFTKSYMLRK